MDLIESVVAYKTLRNIYVDGESNSVKLGLEHDLDGEECEQAVLKAADKGFLKVVKDSDPKKYSVNLDRIVEEWTNQWKNERESVPVTPENFESFLEGYIKSYFEGEKHSTVREMLVEDFFIGLSNQSNQSYVSRDFEELKERLSKDFKGKRRPAEHVKKGFDSR